MNSRDTFSLFKKGILTTLGKKLVLADNTINLSANKTVLANANKLFGYDASGVPSAVDAPSGGGGAVEKTTLVTIPAVSIEAPPTSLGAATTATGFKCINTSSTNCCAVKCARTDVNRMTYTRSTPKSDINSIF